MISKNLINRRSFLNYALALGALGITRDVASGQSLERQLRGVNLSGAEFGKLSGVGYRQLYPTRTDVEFYRALGCTVIRLPIRWERLQSRPFGSLSSSDGSFRDLDWLEEIVTLITDAGMVCVIDLHNFGKRSVGGPAVRLGTADLPAEALADFWLKVGGLFRNNPLVWFGLMNEPEGYQATEWSGIVQSTVNSLRHAHIGNVVLLPGIKWSSAALWIKSGNGKAFENFNDEAENSIFEVHQYFDPDGSGTRSTCVRDGVRRLAAFERWAEVKEGRRGFLAEFGLGRTDLPESGECGEELDKVVEHLHQHSQIWRGWTLWGGGRHWPPKYHLRLEGPCCGTEREGVVLRALRDRFR
ncbi:endoglucanase [Rhizobium sp. NFR07]|uniref:glycoside hydrolase family 5 protein n=1 Tax=Rhizobium sp. NFR07 TaxID=1566262 RepID=UPI0008E8906E|nr:glycoside hydrolase family 5 protein [Rhizobium sp. NFR07]SFB51044.1 endoglucanase [Rhizobium sp. NFR07]